MGRNVNSEGGIEMARNIGVLIQMDCRHGTDYLTVRPAERDASNGNIVSFVSSLDWAEKLEFDGLRLSGHFSTFDDGPTLVGFGPSYIDRYHFELTDLEKAVKTMRKIHKELNKETGEPGDVFAAFYRAIGANWAIIPKPGENLRDISENPIYLELAGAKSQIRRLIETKLKEMELQPSE